MWTEPLTEKMAVYWNEGFSTSLIADKLNQEFGTRLTRNSVIGRRYRMREKLNLDDRLQLKATHRRKPMPRRVMSKPNGEVPGAFMKPQPIRMQAPPPMAIRRLSLLDLEPSSCRYPVEGEGEFTLFCGNDAKEGHSYCAYHCGVCYGGWK